ncbi:MAG: amidase domain-containing protein [Ruminococcus sp.]|nr:amidase domain-containing protein [Ruminococcus sp.]
MKRLAAITVSGVMCLALILGLANPDTTGNTGLVQAICAEASPVSAGTYVVDYPTGVNVRDGADISCTLLGRADYGVLFTVTQVSGEWGYTKSAACTDGILRSGWIYLGNCKPADGTSDAVQTGASSDTQTSTFSDVRKADYQVVVTSDIGVNMRWGAGTGYGKICVIDTGVLLNVSEVRNGWAKVRYHNTYGWVSLVYTKPYSGTASDSSGHAAASTGSYNFNAALQYAKIYWCKRNPIYQYYTNNNCANFCSQILAASGVKTDDRWRDGSAAFINTLYLRDYFVSKYGIVYLSDPGAADIRAGDIIYTDALGHVMFVTGVTSNGTILCSGNTNNRDSIPVSIGAICAVLKTSAFFA